MGPAHGPDPWPRRGTVRYGCLNRFHRFGQPCFLVWTLSRFSPAAPSVAKADVKCVPRIHKPLERCLGGMSGGRNSVTNRFLTNFLGPFRPESGHLKQICNRTSAQKAPPKHLVNLIWRPLYPRAVSSPNRRQSAPIGANRRQWARGRSELAIPIGAARGAPIADICEFPPWPSSV